MNNVVTTVIRIHSISGLPLLERAVQSLHAQADVVVQPVVVTQRFNSDELESVERLVRRQWFFEGLPTPKLINFEDSGCDDVRSALLNVGIKEHFSAGNRYLGFLDYDDLLYTHAYRVLTGALRDSMSVVAFATIEAAKAVALHDYEFIYSISAPYIGKGKLDLLKENFCPLHSYLVDTSKLDPAEVYFETRLTRLEDYDFLLRIAGRHPCNFTNLGTKIGLYFMRSDQSNSTPEGVDTEADREKRRVWQRNRDQLAAFRSGYEVKLFASDF